MNNLSKKRRILTQAHTLVIGIVVGALLFGGGLAIAAGAALTYEAAPSQSKVFVDGREVYVDAYMINDSNYYKLRDFAKVVDVGVWYDESRDRVNIETDIGYDPYYNGVRPEPETKVIPLQKSVEIQIDSNRHLVTDKNAVESYSAVFTIVEVLRGEKAYERINAANQQNPSAGVGKEYILAWVRAKITSVKDKKYVTLEDIRTNMSCYSWDGELYPSTNPSGINPVNEQPKNVGDSVDGWVAFAVNKSDPEPNVQIGRRLGDAGQDAVFALYD